MDQISYGLQLHLHRMIQQAMHQVLNPLFDPFFSESSYGYRKGRNAEQAVLQCQRYMQEGKRWVVDVDLSKFFDEVNHDVLMAKIKREKAAGRVFDSVVDFIERKLKLRINRSKRQITKYNRLTFLGFGFLPGKEARLKVPKKIQKRFRKKAKLLFRMGRGRNLKRFINDTLNPFLRGWATYYRLCKVKTMVEELDSWLRRRLRLVIWRQWKRPRTRLKRLVTAGLDRDRAQRSAYNGRGPWWNSGASHMNQALPNSFFAGLGLVSLRQLML